MDNIILEPDDVMASFDILSMYENQCSETKKWIFTTSIRVAAQTVHVVRRQMEIQRLTGLPDQHTNHYRKFKGTELSIQMTATTVTELTLDKHDKDLRTGSINTNLNIIHEP